jgi:glutamyl-tRNA synthetase
VTQFRDEGFLADAVVNYLARLGWSHGDDEIFSREQFLQWFDLDHLGRSAAQFDEAKLRWVNAQHMKTTPDAALAQLVEPQLRALDLTPDERLPAICGLFKDRCETTVILAGWAAKFYQPVVPAAEELAQHVTDAVRPAIGQLASALAACTWDKAAIAEAIKETLRATGLKMPQLAMPVRVLVLGTPQTPSLDAVLALLPREDVLGRLSSV